MDSSGRLHMPGGFVGESFEETGVADEVRAAEIRGAIGDGMNRKARRAAAKMQGQADRRQGLKEIVRS